MHLYIELKLLSCLVLITFQEIKLLSSPKVSRLYECRCWENLTVYKIHSFFGGSCFLYNVFNTLRSILLPGLLCCMNCHVYITSKFVWNFSQTILHFSVWIMVCSPWKFLHLFRVQKCSVHHHNYMNIHWSAPVVADRIITLRWCTMTRYTLNKCSLVLKW